METRHKAYKFRMYPNKEQKVLLAKTFGCVRLVYNLMLAEKIAYYKEHGKSITVTPAKYKKEYEFLKEVDSLALANAQLHLQTAYRNFFKDKSIGFPKFKSKKSNYHSYTTNLVNGNIKLNDRTIVLPKLKSVKIKKHRQIPSDYILKSVTVSQEPNGNYYVSVLLEYEVDIKPQYDTSKAIGLDFSMRELYVSSEGFTAEYPRYYRKSQEKLAKEQRILSHRKKGSKNYYKQKRKIAKIHSKIANQRKDFLHKQSRQITNAYDVICIEDLNMKAMSQSYHFGKSVADNGWGMFTSFLYYKQTEQGKLLVKVDRHYPSSKTCSVCGYKNEGLQLKDRFWLCPQCNTYHNRDENASYNIKNEGLRIVKEMEIA